MPIRKILVVDDSKTELVFLTDLLQKNGFAVKTAENADDAMRRLEEEHPDLILMDVVMPGPEVRVYPDHSVHQQEPGNRPRLGHAPGRPRLHREAGQRSRPDVQDQRAELSESLPSPWRIAML